MRGDDAVRPAEAALDAIVVPNHAARNVNGSPATLTVLPEIVAAVGDRLEVWFDGGSDVIRVSVMIGRAYLYAFASMGEAGVERIFDLFHTQMRAALRSLGVAAVGDLDRSSIF